MLSSCCNEREQFTSESLIVGVRCDLWNVPSNCVRLAVQNLTAMCYLHNFADNNTA